MKSEIDPAMRKRIENLSDKEKRVCLASLEKSVRYIRRLLKRRTRGVHWLPPDRTQLN